MTQYTKNSNFSMDVEEEVERARIKFPQPNALMTALTEEVGELAKALMDEEWPRVWAEAVQVSAMAQRLAVEGDPTLDEVREQREAGPFKERECGYRGCPAPFDQTPPCAICYE